MKRQIILLLCFCVSTLLLGCKNTNHNSDVIAKTIRWSQDKDFEIKDIVKDIQFIFLENDAPEAFFSEINKLIIKNNRIYILSDDEAVRHSKLFVFDISGKFLHKIGSLGNGPGEYVRYINFTVTENDEVLVFDGSRRNIMKFNKEGKYVSSIESTFLMADFIQLPNDLYLLSLRKGPTNRKLMLTNDFQSEGNSFFNYHKDFKDDRMNYISFQPFNNKIAYMYPVNDTLFILDHNGSLEQAWVFDFGSRKMSEELKNDAMKAFEERRKGNSNGMYISDTPICIKNYIFAEFMLDNQWGILVYDTKNDKMSHYLFSAETFSIYNINFPLYNLNDSFIVTYLSSESFIFLKENLNFSINPEVDEHLESGSSVIILNTIK